MPALQHFLEHRIGVAAAVMGAFGGVVIHPSEYDDFTLRMVAEKQSVLLKELCPEPVFMSVTKRAALSDLVG